MAIQKSTTRNDTKHSKHNLNSKNRRTSFMKSNFGQFENKLCHMHCHLVIQLLMSRKLSVSIPIRGAYRFFVLNLFEVFRKSKNEKCFHISTISWFKLKLQELCHLSVKSMFKLLEVNYVVQKDIEEHIQLHILVSADICHCHVHTVSHSRQHAMKICREFPE